MTPERFQQILRRTLYSSMSVRRDREWAVKHGFNPDALIVWDKSPRSGAPYVVFVCQHGNVPIEPNHEIVERIRAMDAARVHGGRKAWADHMAGQADRQNAEQEGLREKAFRERFDHEFTPKAEWATRQRRNYKVAK